MLRVELEIVTEPAASPRSSRTHMRSPSWNVLLWTLFELIELVVPLENFGLSP